MRFSFVVAEYNHSIFGALKNALDQAYVEWNKEPMGPIAYAAMGGTRAPEHLRNIAVEPDMVAVHGAVHIGDADMFAIQPMGGNRDIAKIETHLLPAAKNLLDDIVWWGKVLMAARAEAAQKAA